MAPIPSNGFRRHPANVRGELSSQVRLARAPEDQVAGISHLFGYKPEDCE